jgi:hypothetical protein
MIKHIVMFRILDEPDTGKKIELAGELNRIFAPLSEIEPVREFKTGINFSPAPHAWDFVIDSVFDSREKLEEYQVSFEHQDAIRRASFIKKEKAVVDYQY